MKILCCVAGLGAGGAERQLIYLLKGLRDLGHVPALLVFSAKEKVKYIEVFDVGINIYFSGVTSNNRAMGSLKILRDLYRINNIERPELVYSCLHIANTLCRFAKLIRLLNCPVVSSIRIDFDKVYKGSDRFSERILQRVGSGIVTNHYPTHEVIVALGRKNVFYIPNGIPQQYDVSAESQERRMSRHTPIRIISIGRLRVDHKQQDRLINALALLKQDATAPPFSCQIVGTGRDHRMLEKMIDGKKLNGIVELVGHVTDISSIFEQADVMVHNSVVEGCPNVVLEAMSFGVLVVASPYVGSLGIIENDSSGIVASGESDIQLKQAIKRMMLLPEKKYAEMVNVAKRNVREHYSLNVMVNSFIRAFERVREE